MGSLNLQYKDSRNVSEGVGLLISILLRYPEVSSVRYLLDQHALKFRFVILNTGDKIGDRGLLKSLPEALEVFHELEGRPMRICSVKFNAEEQVCELTIIRDVDSMIQSEVGLIVELVKREFSSQLVSDESELPEEELLFQEEVISHMLATIQKNEIDKSFVAVREEGRVLVFKN